jgi:hypothetical protein
MSLPLLSISVASESSTSTATNVSSDTCVGSNVDLNILESLLVQALNWELNQKDIMMAIYFQFSKYFSSADEYIQALAEAQQTIGHLWQQVCELQHQVNDLTLTQFSSARKQAATTELDNEI